MKRIWVALLVFSILGGSVSANAISFKRKKSKKKESVEKEKTAYDKLFSSNHSKAEGFITIHKVKEKVYFELPLSMLQRDMLLGSTVTEISDNKNAIIGSKPTEPLHFRFEKLNNKVCLSAVQTNNVGDDNGHRLKAAIEMSNMNAILQVFDISAYNNDSTAVVFDVTDFFVSDNKLMSPFDKYSVNTSGGRKRLTSFQSNKSFIDSFKAFEDNISVRSCLNYTYSLTGGKGKDIKDEPLTAKVTRSIILLDTIPYRPRLMDSRIGIFPTMKNEYSAAKQTTRSIYYANRWRLEPSDLRGYIEGKKVTPIKPIVFYVDSCFPESWKASIFEAVNQWNEPFEKIGFTQAIQAKEFPKDDPEFDADNLKYSCIRYVPAAITNAMGPSWTDPRTGEIINASVIIFNDVVKLANQWRFLQTSQVDPSVRTKKMPDNILEESIEYIVAHEVGHTLGLMHNMSASAAYPVDSLRSAKFTQKYGTTPSIMDYARFNYVAQPEDKGVKLTPPNLGIYDEYVIKWLYTPLYGLSAKEEQAMLESWIDEHAGDPIYRYGKQQVIARYDPSALEEDLGDDAIKAGDYGIKNLKYIVANMNNWFVDDTDGSHRENLYNELGNQYYRYLKNVMHNVGGIYLTEVKPGTAGKTFQSVPKELQRNSFVWVIKQLKNSDWLHNTGLTDQFGLRVALPPIVCYYTATELLGTYKNVVLSAHVSQDPYTLKAYFDDLYNHVWENAIKGRKPTSGEKILQRLVVDQAADVITKKSKLVKVLADPDEGLGMENAFMPSVDEIVAYGLDPTGLVGQYQNELRELEQVHGKGLVAKQLTSFGHGYDWQYRVNTRTIDDSKTYFYAYALRVKNLLNSRLASADSDTKAHYQTMLYALDEALNALNKK